MLTAHERAGITQQCRDMAGIGHKSHPQHKEASSSRQMKDEADVRCAVSVIDGWGNPFLNSGELLNLSSGVTALPNVSSDLLEAQTKGKLALESFVGTRLITNDVSFYEPVTKLKLNTFASQKKTTSVKIKGQDVILKADRDLFARLAVIATRRQMDMKVVLKHTLGPLPWSIASADGSMAKTNKAKMLEFLEKGIDPVEEVSPTTPWLVDAMAVLHAITQEKIPKTFGELADYLFDRIMNVTRYAPRVDVIFDRYPEISIKNTERNQRAQAGSVRIQITGGNQHTPKQWKKFLTDGQNKEGLVDFLLREWTQDRYNTKLGKRKLFLTNGKFCYKIHSSEAEIVCTQVDDLYCDQEEADTRLLLHANHMANSDFNKIIIWSPDTDVTILACFFQEVIPADILIYRTTKLRNTFVSVKAISQSVGQNVCKALPGLHAITGCDTTSAFLGKGKKKGLSLIKEQPDLCQCMQTLGESFDVSDQLFLDCESFVCSLLYMGNQEIV